MSQRNPEVPNVDQFLPARRINSKPQFSFAVRRRSFCWIAPAPSASTNRADEGSDFGVYTRHLRPWLASPAVPTDAVRRTPEFVHPAIALLRLYPFVGGGVNLVQQRP